MFSREKLWDKRVFFQKNMFDILFCFWMKKFRICGRSFQQGCQKQNPRDQRNFFGKTLFGGRYNLMSFDGCSEENLICKKTQGSSVRHSMRPVEHSKGPNSGRNKTFLTFGQWARMFWVSGTTKLAELPKLHSMWPEQLLEYIELFFKKNAILILFPTFSENFSKS